MSLEEVKISGSFDGLVQSSYVNVCLSTNQWKLFDLMLLIVGILGNYVFAC